VSGRVHHSAVCVADVDASLRFYRDGLGLDVLMDHEFDGDWPTLFGAPGTRLRSVFLGDPAVSDAGIVELVCFDGATPPNEPDGRGPAPGFFLLSFFTDVAATLARLADLGLGGDPRRIEVPGPAGPVAMATVRDPDGVLVELIEAGG
jgi:catechol 2,3-dioxygenase-like lactoylglutathione lyase family enzyme